MNKKILLFLVALLFNVVVSIAQNSVGIGTTVPNPNAVLHLQATGTQGFILPKLSVNDTATFGTLTANDKGVMFFDTTTGSVRYFDGTVWKKIADTAWVSNSSFSATNGLTLNGNIFEWGGNLTKNTTITSSATHSITFTGNPLIIEDAVIASRLVDYDAGTYFVDPDENNSAYLYGNINIGAGRDDDNDFIYFDQGGSAIFWDNLQNKFHFTYPIIAGSLTDKDNALYYLDPSNSGISGKFAGNLSIGGLLGNDNDFLYFDADNEHLRWDETFSSFYLTDDLQLLDNLYVGQGSTTDDDYIFMDGTNEYLSWSESNNRFQLSDDLYLTGSLEITGGISAGLNISTNSSVIAQTNLYVGDKLYHYLDGDTRFDFENDYIKILAGDVDMIEMVEGTLDSIKIGWTSDVDIVLGNGQFKMDAGTGNLYIGHASQSDADFIYFDGASEHFRWDNIYDAFYLTNDLRLYDNISVGRGSSLDDDYIYFDADMEFFKWDNASDRFEISDDLYALGIVSWSSDARFKTEVSTINSALDKVKSMRGVYFTWKKGTAREGISDIGFIAQEVEEVLPELVSTGADGYKSVAYGNITAVLLEAIKELEAKLTTQTNRNKLLEAKLETLNAEVDLIKKAIGVDLKTNR